LTPRIYLKSTYVYNEALKDVIRVKVIPASLRLVGIITGNNPCLDVSQKYKPHLELRDVVLHDQFRTVGHDGIPAVKLENVRNVIVVVIQSVANTYLGAPFFVNVGTRSFV